MLTARKLLQKKMLDVELGLRGVLRGFGLRLGKISKGRFAGRVQELASGNPMLERVTEGMLRARDALRAEMTALDKRARDLARDEATCRRQALGVHLDGMMWRPRADHGRKHETGGATERGRQA